MSAWDDFKDFHDPRKLKRNLIQGSPTNYLTKKYYLDPQKDAAKNAAQAQINAAQMAIDEARAAREQSRADQAPYSQFGLGIMPQLGGLLTTQGQNEYISQNNPLFLAALQNMQRNTAKNQAITGVNRPMDTMAAYRNWTATSAMPWLQNAQMSYFNAANLGQAAAAGQARNSQTAAQRIGGYTTDQGAARAAGIVGAANVRSGMYQDLARGLSSFSGAFGG